MPKFIMLAGAPASDKWKEEDMTVNELLPHFKTIIHEQHGIDTTPSTGTGQSTTPRPVWRSIPLESGYIAIHWSPREWLNFPTLNPPLADHEEGEISFLTATSIYDEDDDDDDGDRDSPASTAALSQLLEQSFTLHVDAPSSQVTPAVKTPLLRKMRAISNKHSPEPPDDGSLAYASQFSSSPIYPTDQETALRLRQQFLILPYLADLAALPTAKALAALEPQTVTVDLLVGIISVAPARTVTIRRTGRDIELVEVLVGDETRAGFSITIWLADGWTAHTGGSGVPREGLRAAMDGLRAGDVVGLRNVALTHFRGRVHGQSLGGRRGAETSLVKVDGEVEAAVTRRRGSGSGSGLAGKLERVKAWTRDFVRPVGIARGDAVGARKRKRPLDSLPPDDTQ